MITKIDYFITKVSKDDPVLKKGLEKGYTLKGALCSCLEEVGRFYGPSEIEVIELENDYEVKAYD